jgi:hypothetical protein
MKTPDLPDRMTIWTTIGGYGGASLILILIFVLTQSVGC